MLSPQEIIRAWKDEDYRSSLSDEQLAALPDAPSNIDQLTDEELEQIAGGRDVCVGTCNQTCNKGSKFE